MLAIKNNQAYIMLVVLLEWLLVLLYKRMVLSEYCRKMGKERHNKTSAITCRIFSLSVHPCM